MTTEEEEQNKEKDTNRNLMLKLAICNMCYIDEYTCTFKEYHYKGAYNTEESKKYENYILVNYLNHLVQK